MPSPYQRQWHFRSQQKAFLEFAGIKHACPEGIYLSLTPGNPTIWTGVLFVHKGPYAAAILRFCVALTTKYPDQPPSITFTSEVFHPLVTPSTTYTTTTASSSSSIADGTDMKQLPAGGLSLRYGFPDWYEKVAINVTTLKPAEVSAVSLEPSDGSECDSDEDLAQGVSRASESKRPSIDEDGSLPRNPNPKTAPWTISDVLHYLKRVFEDEDLLDTLPLELAVNQGAWKAWRAYRAKSKRTSFRSQADQNGSPSKVPKSRANIAATAGASMDWNWEGVWVKRVKAMVNASTSDPVLYAGYDNDETINFLDLDEETIRAIKASIL